MFILKDYITGVKGTKVPDKIYFQNSKGREKLKGKKKKQSRVMSCVN